MSNFDEFDGEIQDLAEELKVSFVLECAVGKANSHFMVAAKLMRVANGNYVWSGYYEASTDTVAKVFEEIGESVAKEVNAFL